MKTLIIDLSKLIGAIGIVIVAIAATARATGYDVVFQPEFKEFVGWQYSRGCIEDSAKLSQAKIERRRYIEAIPPLPVPRELAIYIAMLEQDVARQCVKNS